MRAASFRFVVARGRRDRLVVGAAWLVMVAAITVLCAGLMYSDAVARGGLLRVLLQAPPLESSMQVVTRIAPEVVADVETRVTAELQAAFGPALGTVARSGRSGPFALPEQPAEEVSDLTVFAFADGIEAHATLTRGAWPIPGGQPVQVAVSEPTAQALGLTEGSELTVAGRLEPYPDVTVRVTGVYRIQDPLDPFWRSDRLEVEGVEQGASFTTYGPLMVARDDLLAATSSRSVQLAWRVSPDFRSVDVDGVGRMRSRIGALSGRLGSVVDEAYLDVESGLPGILERASGSLLVNRTGVLLLEIQLVVVAGYALVLVSGLIIEQRRAETALLRTRGASTPRLLRLTILEGLALAVPAAVLGPLLAMGLLLALGSAGPLGAVGVPLEPRLDAGVLLVGAGAALATVVGLLLPAVASVGPLASVRRSIGRQLGRTLPQRWGLDLALMVLAALGLWQLREYGAPLTRSLRGTLGVDPLLVAAPAIGLLAGAVLALRVLPMMARAIERLAARRTGLVPGFGAQQLARRPLRYTRSALLLMVASAIALFASAYSGSWERSQHDQVDYEVGADLRVTAPNQPSAPDQVMARMYRDLPGSEAVMPVVTDSFDLAGSGRTARLVALPPEVGAAIVRFRPDLADEPFGDLMGRLAAERVGSGLVALPGAPARIALDVTVELAGTVLDFRTGDIPPGFKGLRMSIVIHDATGLVQHFQSELATLDPGPQRIIIPLTVPLPKGSEAPAAEGGGTGLTPTAPLALTAASFIVIVTPSVAAAGSLALDGIAVSDQAQGEAWTQVAADAIADWRSVRPLDPADAEHLGEEAPTPVLGVGPEVVVPAERPITGPTPVSFVLRPAALAGQDSPPLPAIVNDRFLAATGTQVGDQVPIGQRFSDPRVIHIVAVTRGFPTLDPEEPAVVVDLASLALLDDARGAAAAPVSQWWLAAVEAQLPGIAAAVQEEPFGAEAVLYRSDLLVARLTDPLALGVIGALALGGLAAAFFAVVGFIISAAIAARERWTEFALLRALGLSRAQLSASLSLENAFLLAVSLCLGIGLGAVLAWIVLPTVSLTPDAGSAVPPVTVELPWAVVAALGTVALVSLLATVAMLVRAVRRADVSDVLRRGDQ